MTYVLKVVIALIMISTPVNVLSKEGSGLETNGDITVEMFYGTLDDDCKSIGLTRELLQSKVELRLRRNGLTPVTTEDDPYYLFVKVVATKTAFSTGLEFRRKITYRVKGKEYVKYATVWTDNTVGAHANSKEYIMGGLYDKLDTFSAKYLSINKL
ncbi:hypothetical protein [Desulfosediminicola ganghwensis]|uniref:hypothetical protein n=1 Tax=Desulfosediminicola ganghwensis TaxID=2569540 RepID=UPI0010AC0E75|nr:hypothetical protein [Desulfosediminicola ganghwensis]